MCSSILIFCTFCWISTITSDRQVKLSFVFFVVLVDQCVCWNLENTLCGTRVCLSLGITEHLVMWVFPFPPLDLSGVLLQSVTLISWNVMKRSYAHTYILALIFFLILLHTQSIIVFCLCTSFMCCVLFEGIWLQMQEFCLFHCYSSFSCFLPLLFFYSFGFFCLLLTWPSPPVCFTIISTQIII